MQQIIEACKSGNSFAQKRLFDHYVKRLFRLAMRYVRSTEDAEEMVMNGFLKFFHSLETFEYHDEPRLEVWLKRIVVNECLMHLRRQKVTWASLEDIDNQMDTPTESVPTDSMIEAEELYALILELPAGYRTIFNLYAIEGYSHQEIAQQLGISQGTSKSQLSKARAVLQTLLSQRGYAQRTH